MKNRELRGIITPETNGGTAVAEREPAKPGHGIG